VSTYKLTQKARSDLAEILLYTTDTWGAEQAERYMGLLLDGFDLIAEKPGMGRTCERLALGLRRFELGKHVVFYKPKRGSVIIGRILHQKALPAKPHFIDS
jgi:toxin ParE1/3/4